MSVSPGQLQCGEACLSPPQRLAPQVQQATAQEFLQLAYRKLLEDTELTDVTFAVDGQLFLAHRCVLSWRSPSFHTMFDSGKGMHEGGSHTAGKDIVIKDVSAEVFRVLLRFLYAHTPPEEEDFWEGLVVGEMARVSDLFEASELYVHCVKRFTEELVVCNGIERLVLTRNSDVGAGGGGNGLRVG